MASTQFSDTENRLIDEYYDFIKHLVKIAGVLVKEGYDKSNDDKGITEKIANWDMVTEYDKKTEEFLKTSIRDKYPNHKLVWKQLLIVQGDLHISKLIRNFCLKI